MAAPQTGFGLLIPDRYVLEDVTRQDIIIASLAWGFTIGFGWLTTWTAVKQTKQMWVRHGTRTLRNAYIWMIWLEILVCLIFGVICFLYLLYIIPPSFEFYFVILTTWALQVQFLLQIIVNRCGLLMTNPKRATQLKIGVAVIITAVNISVYNIWIPARLQISDRYVWINEWWDRIEKGIYLIVDACLNGYFIIIVKRNLVQHGLTKYRTLMHFNMFIVGFSLSMDVLIISMMSLSNTFVYMQFHPLAYIVKLNIEMSMADLIGKIARSRNCGVISEGDFSGSGDRTASGTGCSRGSRNRDSRCADVEAGCCSRRHHHHHHQHQPSFVKFELRTIGTGADIGGSAAAATERNRFASDSDTLVTRSDSLRPRGVHNNVGLETPREVYHYGSYGVGIVQQGGGKPAGDVAVTNTEGTSSGKTSYGDREEEEGDEDLERIRAQTTSRDGILPSPPAEEATNDEERQNRVTREGGVGPQQPEGTSWSGSRGWSPFRRPP